VASLVAMVVMDGGGGELQVVVPVSAKRHEVPVVRVDSSSFKLMVVNGSHGGG
jgi:hypothetical protein